ncbi:EAL domain-containing protein [Wenzhouxiangella sp. XN79A]|uniref:putative bifunctional diguanylate cyclase/phosphodiesterase n=1 Tax=Wenzhouxiangella sp. XN79A TaxID=2724193 RepID=UPI00144A8CBB|nr:GGDEF domain-containing phosphodiesterase [Wenzhouxiangella sp. XN79A]NKI35258.1 EAL domain-containing protein [Wenzhouxiangella sp. XN79A]
MRNRDRTRLLSALNSVSWVIGAALFAVLLALTALLNRELAAREARAIQAYLDTRVVQVQAELMDAADDHASIHRRMAARIGYGDDFDPGFWRADARTILNDFAYYDRLAVLDRDMNVLAYEGPAGVGLAPGDPFPIGPAARRRLEEQPFEEGAMALEPMPLAGRPHGLLFMTSVPAGDEPGWLAVVVELPAAIAAELEDYEFGDIALRSQMPGARFRLPADVPAAAFADGDTRPLEITLDDGQSRLRFELALRPEARAAMASGLPETVLGLGSVLALLTSVAALLAMASARQARFLAQANRSLNDEIHDRELAERELAFLLTHDTLTDLPNRAGMMQALDRAVARRAPGRSLAVLYLDLDQFKDINETLGHHVGDELLRQLPVRLGSALDPADRIGRLGGDEFLVLAERRSRERITELARALLAAFDRPFAIDEHALFVTVSIGVTTLDADQSPAELVQNADAALFRAKHLGRNQFAWFDPELVAEVQRRLTMSRAIREALDSERFTVVYQPIVDLETLEMRGVEALLRWPQDDGPGIPPREFIRVAEETGLVHRLGQYAVERALDDLQDWWRQFGSGPWLAVNISGAQFREPDFVDALAAQLQARNVPPERIHLEITEDVLIENLAQNRAVLDRLDRLGMSLVVDDFGVGYSSMAYIKNFPVSAIKIDQGFIRDLESDPDDQAITRTICDLSRMLRLDTVAEGIEHPAQLTMLRRFGCPYGQGFLFLEPSGPDVIRDVLAGRRSWVKRAEPATAS